MKILVIVPSYKPAYIYGGPIRSIASLCASLTKADIDITVFTTNANGKKRLQVDLGKQLEVDGVKVIYFNRWTQDHSNFSPSLLWHLSKEIVKYDVVHIQSWWNMVAVPAAMLCLMKGVKPIISPRGSLTAYTLGQGLSKSKRMFHSIVGRKLLSSSFLHLTSERECSEAEIYSLLSKKFVIPNIVEEQAIVQPERKDKIFQVVFLGRIDPAKNLEMILELFSEQLTFSARLMIAGEGKTEYVEKLKKQAKKSDDICWLGNVDGIEKQKLLASSDVLVLPSHTENFGNVILEALGQGTAVLVSDGVGLSDFVTKYELGAVVKEGVLEWKNALQKLNSDILLRNTIRQTAPQIIKETMGEKVLVERYKEMYQQTSGTDRTSTHHTLA